MSMADPGDEVFFHHKGQPKCGKVLSAGRHGCTVDHEGQQHRLKWEHLAGHKSRAQQDYKVIDHGLDGLIVENQHGRRRLIQIPPEAKSEKVELTEQQIRGSYK